MASTKKQEVEANVAVEAVKAADAKVEEIKAQREADKAKKHEERLKKHPKMGKVDNIIAENWKKGVAFALTGGLSLGIGYVAGEKDLFGFKKRKQAKLAAEATDITPPDDEESTKEPPFEV